MEFSLEAKYILKKICQVHVIPCSDFTTLSDSFRKYVIDVHVVPHVRILLYLLNLLNLLNMFPGKHAYMSSVTTATFLTGTSELHSNPI